MTQEKVLDTPFFFFFLTMKTKQTIPRYHSVQLFLLSKIQKLVMVKDQLCLPLDDYSHLDYIILLEYTSMEFVSMYSNPYFSLELRMENYDGDDSVLFAHCISNIKSYVMAP